jgi:hypothetical protein
LRELVKAYEVRGMLWLVTNSFGRRKEAQRIKKKVFAAKSMDYWKREVHHKIGQIPH